MNIFKQFWFSLFSPKDIAKFRFQGIGKTILFVFLLVLISALPTFIYSTISIKDGVNTFNDALENKLPAFEIKDGQLHTGKKEPIIHNSEDYDIYLDSSGTLSAQDIELTSNNALALLESEFVIVANGEMQSQSYSLLNGLTITHEDLLNMLTQMDELLIVAIIIICIITFIFAAGFKFIEISIMALMARLLASISYPKLQYRHFWRLTAYCVTLPTLFFTIMSLFQTNVIGGMFVNWGVTFTMLYLTLKEIPKPQEKQS